MERLTSNKKVQEMGMFELAHNSCYEKDGKARYRDYDLDIDAKELTRKLLKDYADSDDSFTDDEDFDDWMMDYLQSGMDSMEGLLALFYRNLWAMADLHQRLKHYEDLEDQGKLPELPLPEDTLMMGMREKLRKCKGRYWFQGHWNEFGLGYFHKWGGNFEEFENGAGNYSTAIVELPNGKVVMPVADDIVFLNPFESGLG